MGANAQTSVPLFTAGEVLTAANQNISAGTGVPVFATTTTRDAAFGGSGEKVLAEGQLAYIEASNVVQYYDGSAWATVGPSTAGGFTFINSTTISAAATTNVNDVFSATYDNYKIIFVGTGSTGTDALMSLRLRVSGSDATTNYTYQRTISFGTTVLANLDLFGTDEFGLGASNATNKFWFEVTFMSPFLSVSTKYGATGLGDSTSGIANFSFAGVNTNSTSYTGFSLLSTGTISGTLKVYGLANS